MEMNGLFQGSIDLAHRALDLRAARHNRIAANLANMDTPHYKAFDLMVEERLAAMTQADPMVRPLRTHPTHLGGSDPSSAPPGQLVARPGQPYGTVEGNTVDIDREMADLSENSLKYNATAQILSRKLEGLKAVIRGGGR